jgi:hypothetical protein
VERRVDLSSGQRAIQYRFVCTEVLASKNIAVLALRPYSPDHTPCDFFPFPKSKSFLKGKYFVLVENV